MTDTPITSRATAPQSAGGAGWGWFRAWAAVGALLAFGMVSLGPLALLPAALAGSLIYRSGPARRSSWGLMSGAGILLLVIAFLNRAGPGVTCYRTATSAGCSQHLDPIPWLMSGLALTLVGLVFQSRRMAPSGRAPT